MSETFLSSGAGAGAGPVRVVYVRDVDAQSTGWVLQLCGVWQVGAAEARKLQISVGDRGVEIYGGDSLQRLGYSLGRTRRRGVGIGRRGNAKAGTRNGRLL